MISVSGCGSTPKNDYCLIAEPIRPTSGDIDSMSDDLVEQLLIHNELYDKLCK